VRPHADVAARNALCPGVQALGGCLQRRYACCGCGCTSIAYEQFSHLSLQLPDLPPQPTGVAALLAGPHNSRQQPPVSIPDLLRAHFQVEGMCRYSFGIDKVGKGPAPSSIHLLPTQLQHRSQVRGAQCKGGCCLD
jgi:hypothetical protein